MTGAASCMASAGSLPWSLSVMVPSPVPSATVAPTGSNSSTEKLSVSSRISSSSTGTRIVRVVSPGSNRSVPVVRV